MNYRYGVMIIPATENESGTTNGIRRDLVVFSSPHAEFEYQDQNHDSAEVREAKADLKKNKNRLELADGQVYSYKILKKRPKTKGTRPKITNVRNTLPTISRPNRPLINQNKPSITHLPFPKPNRFQSQFQPVNHGGVLTILRSNSVPLRASVTPITKTKKYEDAIRQNRNLPIVSKPKEETKIRLSPSEFLVVKVN